MPGKSDYLENAILNHVLRNTALTSPATVYVGLFTVAPGENSAGTEVSGNAYARQSCAFGAPGALGSGTAGQVSNSADVTFPAANPAAWGTVVAFGVFDAATNGNLLYFANLTASKTIDAGDQAKFAAGTLTITED
jgi:hypothetical protein